MPFETVWPLTGGAGSYRKRGVLLSCDMTGKATLAARKGNIPYP